MRTYHPRSKSGYSTTRLWDIWRGMLNRCQCETNTVYSYYGGRGISVCKEWMDFDAFKTWAEANGYESNLTIDRIDVNGDYGPENCRFISHRDQCLNRRSTHWITIDGETRCRKEWAEMLGISPSAINYANKRGLSSEVYVRRKLAEMGERVWR